MVINDRVDPIDRKTFEKINYCFQKVVPKRYIDEGWQLYLHENPVFGDIVFTLRNFMAHGNKEIKDWQNVPTAWHDHLKYDILMWTAHRNSFLSRIVKKIVLSLKPYKTYKITTVTHYHHYCPHFGKESGSHLEFLMFKPYSINSWDGLNERFK